MDFEAIKRLKLKAAYFGNPIFKDIHKDEDFLNELFECDNKGSLFIHDDASVGHSVYIADTYGLGSDKTFQIKNDNHEDVFLMHIDGVLYDKDTKCDCAFLTKNELGFVEFKANATNNTTKAIKDNYEKACKQLAYTYKDFRDKCRAIGIEIEEMLSINSFAVFNRTVPNNNAYQKMISAKFQKEAETHTILHFKNKHTL